MTQAKDQLLRLLGEEDKAVGYEQARDLLDHPDVEVRCALAAREDLEPEILFFLAQDPDKGVRRTVAGNPAAPIKANEVLAADSEDDVRADLAGRLGRLLPDLSDDEKDKAYRTTHQALTLLARDQLPRVRSIVSETLKLVPTAPHDLIMVLAQDQDETVSAPALQFSPVLSDDDLLAIIASSPLSASLTAISKREGVGYTVSDAIFYTGDTSAVSALLSNQSAQIREETLDAIISAAPSQTSWHKPLVGRSELSSSAALRIAGFVADHLIEELANRADFPSETTAHLKDVVHSKLKKDQDKERMLAPDFDTEALDPDALALASQQVKTLAEDDLLDPEHVMTALDDGNVAFAMAAIARLADIDHAAIRAAVNARSAKGLQAICWKANFSAQDAVHVQMSLGRVPPDEIITPRPDGSYDATESEMTWQIELFMDEAKVG